MKFIPNAIARQAGRTLLQGRKYSPTIMFVGGVAGVVTSTVLACKATLKLDDVLTDLQEKKEMAKTLKHADYSEEDRQKDLAYIQIRSTVAIAKLYALPISLGVLSIAALTGSHLTLTRRNAALTAAYATLERGFKQYRERVAKQIGDDKEYELRHNFEKVEEIDESGKKTVVKKPSKDGPSIYARFFDEYSKSWSKDPEYNRVFLKCQQTYANDLLQTRGHVFLNEVYDNLGLERTSAGAVVGWVISKDGDNYIDFGIFDGEKERARAFVNGAEAAILLDFNVDGVIYDKI